MKRLITISILLIAMFSCNSKQEKQTNQKTSSNTEQLSTYTLDELLDVADQVLDDTVIVKGSITHTCKHSGRRCFIVGNDPNISLRVEAKGKIGGFNRELTGSEVLITGIVKERRLTKEYIKQHEESIKEKQQEDGSAETCQAEMKNIDAMKEWMRKNNKDYYSIYFMDGLNYEEVEK